MSDPKTPAEWQEATDIAHACLAVELARLYGFLEPCGATNIERCADILSRARARGYKPGKNAIRDWLAEGESDEADAERIYRVVTKAWELSGKPKLEHLVPFLAYPAALSGSVATAEEKT